MATSDSAVVDQLPRELIEAVQREAEQNADRVAAFLHEMARVLPLPEDKVLQDRYDSAYLLELGAVLWMFSWQEAGVLPAFDGLPRPTTALGQVTRSAAKQELDPGTPLIHKVLKVFARQFSWQLPAEFGTFAITSDFDEEQFARNLAVFVFSHLHLIENPS